VLYCGATDACNARPHCFLTLPIIGRAPSKWNVFSIFIYHEIFIATLRKMA